MIDGGQTLGITGDLETATGDGEADVMSTIDFGTVAAVRALPSPDRPPARRGDDSDAAPRPGLQPQ